MKNNHCNCRDECKKCTSKSVQEDAIRAVILDEGEAQSKHCSRQFYSPYSFKDVSIGKYIIQY